MEGYYFYIKELLQRNTKTLQNKRRDIEVVVTPKVILLSYYCSISGDTTICPCHDEESEVAWSDFVVSMFNHLA